MTKIRLATTAAAAATKIETNSSSSNNNDNSNNKTIGDSAEEGKSMISLTTQQRLPHRGGYRGKACWKITEIPA
jgi:hypothetical protein